MRRFAVALVCLALLAGCSSNETGEDLPPNLLGDRAYEAGDYEAAAQYYTMYLNENPNDFMSLYRRGVAFDKLGDTSAALASLSRALEVRPDSRDALLARAHAYYKSGNRKMAMTDLERAMSAVGFEEASPHEKVLAYGLLSQIAYQGGEHDTALNALDHAIHLAEEFEGHVSIHHYRTLLYNRSMTAFSLGFYGPAREDYEAYLVVTEDSGIQVTETDYYNACFLNYMAEDFDRATDYIAYLNDEQLEVLAQKTQDPTFFLAAGEAPQAESN